MSDPLDTLRKVLILEKKRNFDNTAVAGGLENFSSFLKKLEINHDISPKFYYETAEIFSSYQDYDLIKRRIVIENLINSLTNQSIKKTENSFSRKQENTPLGEIIYPVSQDKALYADVRSLNGIGEKNYKLYNRLGIFSVYDLLRYFPRRYQDFSKLKPIDAINYGEELTIIGTISQPLSTRTSKNGRLKITSTTISDGTGTLRLIWFNSPFLSKQLQPGVSIIVSGKVEVYLGRLVMNNPEWERLDKEQLHTNRIVPIYPLTSGISQRQLRKNIYRNLEFWRNRVIEYLPDNLIHDESFPWIADTLLLIHFPDNDDNLIRVKRRLAFEEIFFLQLGVLIQKRGWKKTEAKVFEISEESMNKIASSLPYMLTHAQNRAIEEILKDLRAGKPMSRLLQGDVGSGKTVVARFAIDVVIKNGSQAAVLAPTSILAEQHFKTLSDMLISAKSVESDEIALLIGSTPKKDRKIILDDLSSGKIKVIIGTHALLEDLVIFNNLQLAVVDEQHRFGVEQRNLLQKKGDTPHLLVMSATPIPRSLALTIYGDMDVSVIDQLPSGRKPVETRLLRPNERETAYNLIRSQIINGFQAFIVYPMIEEEAEEFFTAAVNEHARISKKVFPDLRVGLMHGKLKPSEKEEVMQAFRDHKYDILVSTTVIEVGVDIPNATVVLIEGADHFGLAQLHQIRGRVGRNSDNSFCLLIPDEESGIENERLTAMVKTTNGFELADLDLKQRGPGEFLGTRQSGYVTLRFANLTDLPMIERSRNQAQKILNDDPKFEKSNYQLLYQELRLHWPEIKIN